MCYFLYNDISQENFLGNTECLEHFIDLDDNDIWSALKVWSKHPDRILSTLSSDIVNRLIFKVEISSEPFSSEYLEEIRTKISQSMGVTREEAGYFMSTPSISKNMYNPADDSIDLLYKDGRVKNVAQASDMLNVSLLSRKVVKYYLCYRRFSC